MPGLTTLGRRPDLSLACGSLAVEELRAAIDTHGVLVFPSEKLSEDQQIAFACLFGPLDARNGIIQTGIKQRISKRLVDISNIDDKGELLDRQNRRRMGSLGNQLWHTDASFKATTAKYSLLHAHTVVSEGGETQYADMCAAYDALPRKMKDRLAGLTCGAYLVRDRGPTVTLSSAGVLLKVQVFRQKLDQQIRLAGFRGSKNQQPRVGQAVKRRKDMLVRAFSAPTRNVSFKGCAIVHRTRHCRFETRNTFVQVLHCACSCIVSSNATMRLSRSATSTNLAVSRIRAAMLSA